MTFKAVQFMADTRISTGLGLRPHSRRERRIVSHVLVMTALEFRPPVVLGVLIEADYLSHHCRRARSRYLDFDPAGFHHRKIVNAMNQQTPDASTRGMSCL